MDRVRAGRPLPGLGIEAPDARTLVLRLSHPDPLLMEKLASPGMGRPWKRRDAPSWGEAVGIGPYRVSRYEPGRALTCVRADSASPVHATADTLTAHFVIGAPRVRTLLRHGVPDLVWPLPPAIAGTPLPAGYAFDRLEASPPRRLLMVMRADVPPTTKLPARHVLVHALNHEELMSALGSRTSANDPWLAGGPPFEFPRLDAAELRAWLDRGKLGASFHVVMAYDADGAGADIARTLQGEWAAQGLYVELRALRGVNAAAEPLRASAAQVQLVEAQAPMPGAAAELATLVMPLRGPAVGSFRTGWRTREFDRWIGAGSFGTPNDSGPLDPGLAQARLTEERVALPLARLSWAWARRDGAAATAVRFTAATGPEFSRP